MPDQVVIDLISSSPPAKPCPPSRPQPRSPTVSKKRSSGGALVDIPDEVVNGSPQPSKRPCSEKTLGAKIKQKDRTDLSLLSDLASDSVEPPRPCKGARQFPQPSGLFRDSSGHLNDPIEFSSTPNIPAKNSRDVEGLDFSDWFPSSPPKDQDKSGRSTKSTESRARDKPSFGLPDENSRLPSYKHARHQEWDPVSSSAPEKASKHAVIELDSDSDDGAKDPYSDESFPDILDIPPSQPSYRPRSTKPKKASASKTGAKSSAKATATTVTTTARERELEKERKAVAREADKERKQRDKEAAKSQKAKDKQWAAALVEANKVRTDKKISGREMIVDLPNTLDEGVTLQAQTLLKELDIQDTLWASPVSRVVRWRRKVRARWDEETGRYEPIPERVEVEGYALAVLDADEFVQACLNAEDGDLDRHTQMMKRHFDGHTLIYLIEGLGPWMRKNRNLRNRQFVSAVRGDREPSQASTRRKTTTRTEYVDEDAIEDGLLQLQLVHGAMIHHTNAGIETAQWIVTFTQHISTVPYRRRRDEENASAAAFCMESGQVRTGDDAKDAYVRMLQEITRVTAPIAYGIAAEFGSVSRLVRGLEQGGPLTLQDCRKGANKDGDLTETTIRQAVSKRLYKVFTGRDETSTEI